MAGRRAAGDGSVYQDRDDPPRWRGSVVIGWKDAPGSADGTGRQVPIRRYVTGKTEREAARKVRALIAERDTGRTTWQGITCTAWVDAWLTECEGTLSPNTVDGYRTATKRFTQHVGARLRLDALRREHLEALYGAMLADGKAVRTVHHTHATIRRLLNVAVNRGLLTVSPAVRVELPTKRQHPAAPPPPEDVVRLLDLAAARGEGARWLLGLLLGLRQGEVLGLTWECVDFTNGCVRVAYSLARKRGAGHVLKPTKSDRVRVLPLPPVLAEALRTQQRLQRAARLRAGADWRGWRTVVDGRERDVYLVFPTGRGTPLSRQDDWAAWHRLLDAAGLPATRLHDARVAAGTLLAWAGVHPRVAMEILGHSDISVTMSVYTQVPSEVARDAISSVETLLNSRRVASTGSLGVSPA